MTATHWTCANSNCNAKNTYYPPAEKIKAQDRSILLTEMKTYKQAVSKEVVVTCSSCNQKGKITVTTYES